MTRSKWILVTFFWIFQALTAMVICAFLWGSVGKVDGPSGVVMPVVSWQSFTNTLAMPEFIGWMIAFAMLVPILQVMFLLPVYKPRYGAGHAQAWLSMAVGGIVIGGMLVAAVFAAREVWDEFVFQLPGFSKTFIYVGVGVSWLFGTALLVAFSRGPSREDMLSRLAAKLFVGTIVEVAAIIPLDALVRKKETCHCWAGTYVALLICGAMGAVVFGPAIFLPLLVKRRKRYYEGKCQICGYDMSGNIRAGCCSECGAGWRATTDTAAVPSSISMRAS